MDYATWAPSAVAIGALGVVFYRFQHGTKDIETKLETETRALDTKVELRLAEDKHVLLCENNTLKINTHITRELGELKDETFNYLRVLDKKLDMIAKNGDR